MNIQPCYFAHLRSKSLVWKHISHHALTMLLLIAVAVPTYAQSICPRPKANLDSPEELRILEKDVNIKEALKGFSWLEDGINEAMKRNTTVEELLRDTEGFQIPYANSVMIARGVILKQNALLERERLETANLKRSAGMNAEADVEKAKKRYETARRQFCAWLKDRLYVD